MAVNLDAMEISWGQTWDIVISRHMDHENVASGRSIETSMVAKLKTLKLDVIAALSGTQNLNKRNVSI